MRYLPTFLDVAGQPILVIGGTEAAARKIRLLKRAGADVTLVAPEANGELAELEADGQISWRRRRFHSDDAIGNSAVFSATGVESVDRSVAESARAAGVPVNVVDRPELSSFIMPSIVDRDPILIGITSSGTAPVLARSVRAQIEALLPPGLGRLARFAGRFRTAAAAAIAPGSARRRFWEGFFDSGLARRIIAGIDTGAREEMLSRINRPRKIPEMGGRVAIVGAGPGDPDLLTFKAMRRLQEADVIIYDKLVAPEILDYARRDAERIYAGKSRGHHSKTQTEINALMVKHAASGKRVVRLKGGDPFVFGRGGEEREHLLCHGLPVEVVPGITAATACAASSGIPLTLRGVSQAVTFVTGHAENGEPDLDWDSLVRLNQTLAIYMGVSTAATTAERLISHGLSAHTPVALIEKGTQVNQRVLHGELVDLGILIEREEVTGPALIIIGEVARTSALTELPQFAAVV